MNKKPDNHVCCKAHWFCGINRLAQHLAVVTLGSVLGFGAGADVKVDGVPAEYDYLIQNGIVIDGTGRPRRQADLAILNGSIAAVGDLKDRSARQVIDATGQMVVPGFIDVHSHADDQQGHWRGMRSPDPKRRAAPAHVSQGVTTAVVNSDGLSPDIPLDQQIAAVETRDFALNLAYMAAHARIRFAVMGADSARPATAAEVKRMRELLTADMRAGSWGMAAVLEMRDGRWATTEELIGLTRALKPFDGAFIAHPRSLGRKPAWWVPSVHAQRGSDYPAAPSMFEASQELIRIAEANDIRVSMSHIAMRGPDPEDDVVRTVEAVEAARGRGVPIYADLHVYKANPLGVYGALIPFWAATEGTMSPSFHIHPTRPHRKADFNTPLERTLQIPEKARALRGDVAYLIERWGGPEEIFITDFPEQSFIGRSLAELASADNLSPVEMAIKLAREGYPHYIGGALGYGNSRREENIRLLVSRDWVAGDTDGYTARPGDPGYLHPRFYGAYAAWLKTYVVDEGLVSLEFAIRNLTGLAAEIVGLPDRGILTPGYAADLSLIDVDVLQPTASFYDIHRFSQGFTYVFINGVPVVANRELTWATPGKVLKKLPASHSKDEYL